MFIRQFFKYIKDYKKYKDCPLILFEQPNHFNFARSFDSKYFEDIILYTEDLFHFSKDLKKKLKNYEFTTVISCPELKIIRKQTYDLAKLIPAKYKYIEVTQNGKTTNKYIERARKVYNSPIYTEDGVFELERKRIFFEKVLGEAIPEQNLKIEPFFNFKDEYITISLLAMSNNRCYTKEKWLKILNYTLEETPDRVKLLFIGSSIDYDYTKDIIETLNNSRCINLCGLTDSAILPSILQNSKLLIAPETGTVHIASAISCKTVCLSCGAHYGRMLPHKNVRYVFPHEFTNLLKENNSETIKTFYRHSNSLKTADINEIDVISAIKDMLNF